MAGKLSKSKRKRGTAAKRKPAAPKKTRGDLPNTGSEAIPPGATRAAADRETLAGGDRLGTDRPYHAADDCGSPDESYEALRN
jgi:hypothetical protein